MICRLEAIAALMVCAFAAVLAITLAWAIAGCKPRVEPLSPESGRELTDYAAKLMRCETEARAADSFKAFDACAKDAGLK